MDLGTHPKLGALVGALLEVRFLLGHPYLAMGTQVGALLELLLWIYIDHEALIMTLLILRSIHLV